MSNRKPTRRNPPCCNQVSATALAGMPVLALLCSLLGGCGGGSGAPAASGGTPLPGDVIDNATYAYGPNDALSPAQANEINSEVSHQLLFTASGSSVNYTTTTGHLIARDANGNAEASLFYVAYVATDGDSTNRPLTFLYNGGPGSSSIWLKLGAWAPNRVDTPDPLTTGWPDFSLVDNQQSLIDTTDLVFIDPPGTGFSEAITPSTNRSYWGVDTDAAVVRDFIERYLAVNQRSSSPLYLYGESYGTTRTDVLAPLLELAGIHLTGIVLNSCVLDYNDLVFPNADIVRSQNYIAEVFPSFAEVSDYFEYVTPSPASPDAFAQQMRDFIAQNYDELAPYGPTFSGIATTPTYPTSGVYDTLSGQTGLSTSALTAYLGPGDYLDHTVPGSVIGSYDGRVVAAEGSALIANDPDPSDALVSPFVDIFSNQYLPTYLKYVAVNAPYEATSSDAINNWNFSHGGQTFPDTIPDLLEALTLNPDLKVLVINGYHDFVTPFFGTEKDLARLKTVSGLNADIQILHYPGGHMTYLDDDTHPHIKADLARFYAGQAIDGAMTLADLPDPWPGAAPAAVSQAANREGYP